MHPNRTIRICLTAVAVIAISIPSPAQKMTYNGSIQVTTGDYFFTERTRSVYLSSGLSAEIGRFTLSASVPIVLQDSPWVSYSVVGTLPTGGTDPGAISRRRGGGPGAERLAGSAPQQQSYLQNPDHTGDSIVPVDTISYSQLGVGDPGFRLDASVVQPLDGRLSVSISAACKPPIADVDRGFGTGSWDAGLGMTASTRIGRLFVLVSGEHWWFGDMPDVSLNDAWSYSFAVGLSVVTTRLAVMASYSGFTAILDWVEPPRQLGFGLSLTPDRKYSVSLSASVGLTESASDVSGGIGWSLKI